MLKILRDGEPFPKDFWNYNVNPITGFYIARQENQTEQAERKYNKTPQSL